MLHCYAKSRLDVGCCQVYINNETQAVCQASIGLARILDGAWRSDFKPCRRPVKRSRSTVKLAASARRYWLSTQTLDDISVPSVSFRFKDFSLYAFRKADLGLAWKLNGQFEKL